jgi:hypothetical protein
MTTDNNNNNPEWNRDHVRDIEMCKQYHDKYPDKPTEETMKTFVPADDENNNGGGIKYSLLWTYFIRESTWDHIFWALRQAGYTNSQLTEGLGIRIHREGNLLRILNYDNGRASATFNPRNKSKTEDEVIRKCLLHQGLKPVAEPDSKEEALLRQLRMSVDAQLTEIYSQYEKEKQDKEKDEKSKTTLTDLLKGEDISKALRALDLAEANSQEVFLDEFGQGFAAMKVEDHVEVHPMDESRFKNWISGLFYKEENDLLNEQDLTKIVRILQSKAEFDPKIPRRQIDVRVRAFDRSRYNLYNKREEEWSSSSQSSSAVAAEEQDDEDNIENFDEIYYDLTNRRWDTVKLTTDGWSIDPNPPILFRRYGAEKPQVYPADPNTTPPDTLEKFIELINLKREKEDNQKLLLKAYYLSLYWPNIIPKPILMMLAVQGSSKTTTAELIRDGVDPSAAKTTSLPKEAINLKQYLAHNYCSFFDNVSHINDEQSDIICRGTTGAGDMKRKLYENNEDVIYRYRRIISLNGITNAATRPDLLDRALIVDLGKIEKKDRKLLRAIRREYRKLKPQLLSFCFDVICEVMKERQKWRGNDEDFFGLKEVIMDENGGLPRMADWAILAEQICAKIAEKEGKPYKPGTFLKAFDENLESMNTEALKESIVAEALIAFMTDLEVVKKKVGVDGRAFWDGSPTQLLAELEEFISTHDDIKVNTCKKPWPQSASELGSKIQEISTNLANIGIVIDRKRTKHNVQLNISKMPIPPTPPTPLHQGQKPSSDDGQNGVGWGVDQPTSVPTPENPENRAQNPDGCKGVGGVGYVPKSVVSEDEFEVSDGDGNGKGSNYNKVLQIDSTAKYSIRPHRYFACQQSGCMSYFDDPLQLLEHIRDANHGDYKQMEWWLETRGLLGES